VNDVLPPRCQANWARESRSKHVPVAYGAIIVRISLAVRLGSTTACSSALVYITGRARLARTHFLRIVCCAVLCAALSDLERRIPLLMDPTRCTIHWQFVFKRISSPHTRCAACQK
jgi:hypothetical protein